MEKCLRYLLLAGLLLVHFTARADGPLMESSLSHRRFTTADGLPQMQTETIWQDKAGYIYIGTLSGFVRYDGHTMTSFLGGRRENIVAFREADGQVNALGFVRQWTLRGEKLEMKPIDPAGQLLLNNFNTADLPPGYMLLEDRREQGRILFHLEAGKRVPVLESTLLDEMTPDRKLYLDSLELFIPTREACIGSMKEKRPGLAGKTISSPLSSRKAGSSRCLATAFTPLKETASGSFTSTASRPRITGFPSA